jgi:hypothetical protein
MLLDEQRVLDCDLPGATYTLDVREDVTLGNEGDDGFA